MISYSPFTDDDKDEGLDSDGRDDKGLGPSDD
jgi:hypothetical protein